MEQGCWLLNWERDPSPRLKEPTTNSKSNADRDEAAQLKELPDPVAEVQSQTAICWDLPC
jgi:hypothetical protein